ncbi:hypothetical protein FRC08_013005 [Ceratobasidium sp. 394]|nr:hypothetical protein FRC08_013005 [Ceratobasidium sp. 394]
MMQKVIEIHGSNMHLRCTECKRCPDEPTTASDIPLLTQGWISCSRCTADSHGGTSARLLPEVSLDDGQTELWTGNRKVLQLASKDGDCDVLLLMDPRFQSKGAAHLIQTLAKKVHESHGIVVYVGWKRLTDIVWRPYVDLHIEQDVDTWASNYMANLRSTLDTV